MVAVGDLCLCRQTDTVLWVAVRADDSGRWFLKSKQIDGRGRAAYGGRSSVGVGDIVAVKAAPQYQVGEILKHNGLDHKVLVDHGDEVELLTPSHSRPLADGRVRVRGGNRITVSKSDIALELMR
jgi:hypothetical protein